MQGPDQEAATAIARHLASGQAKLANLGGKQVLLFTNPNHNKVGMDQSGGVISAPKQASPTKLQVRIRVLSGFMYMLFFLCNF